MGRWVKVPAFYALLPLLTDLEAEVGRTQTSRTLLHGAELASE